MSDPDDDGDGSRPTTHYTLLGVSRDASADEIRDAFREKTLEHHPDVSDAPGSDEYMRYLNRARETLLDPDRRTAYDRKLDEIGIEPPGPTGSSRGPRSGHPPRKEDMGYFRDRERPVELEYPQGPFSNRVGNLALRSWLLRAMALLVAASGLLAIEESPLLPSSLSTALSPAVSPVAELLLVVVVIFVGDALRTALGYPILTDESPRMTSWHLLSPLRWGLLGASLWTAGLWTGGTPHAFGASIVVPLVAGAVSVGVICRYFSLPRRLLIALSALTGLALSLPFSANAPEFISMERHLADPLVIMIAERTTGLVAVVAVAVGIVYGGPALIQVAWEYRCRSQARVVPQFWDGLFVVPLVGALLSLVVGSARVPSGIETYGTAAIDSGLTPELAGLVLAWTMPVVAVGFASRLWFGGALAAGGAALRDREWA